MVQLSVISSVLLLAASAAVAHPSTATMSPAELQRRAEFQTFASRSLSGCQDSLRRRGATTSALPLVARLLLMNSVASVVSLLVRHLLFPLPQLITISP